MNSPVLWVKVSNARQNRSGKYAKNTYTMLKFKVALSALTGQPIADICKQYEIAESLVHKWKKQLKEKGSIVFSQSDKRKKDQHEIEVATLYQRIGQLTSNSR